MSKTLLEPLFAIRFGGDCFTNAYYASGDCPNCRNHESLVVKKGIPLSAVEIVCPRCEADKLQVRAGRAGRQS